MTIIKGPNEIGGLFEDFADEGLSKLLAANICGGCEAPSCDDSDCPGICPGLAIQGYIWNQLEREAIKEVKALLREWKRSLK